MSCLTQRISRPNLDAILFHYLYWDRSFDTEGRFQPNGRLPRKTRDALVRFPPRPDSSVLDGDPEMRGTRM